MAELKRIHTGQPTRSPWEKIQRLPCDAYGFCWRKMSICMDFNDRYRKHF